MRRRNFCILLHLGDYVSVTVWYDETVHSAAAKQDGCALFEKSMTVLT